MNKPVFDKVTGKPVNVGKVIDETLPGDSAPTEPTNLALDLLVDELDGRRSIMGEAASATAYESLSDGEVRSSILQTQDIASTIKSDGDELHGLDEGAFDSVLSHSTEVPLWPQDEAVLAPAAPGGEEGGGG